MKKTYEAPTTEMYALQTEGLIATSGISTLSIPKTTPQTPGRGALSKKK